MALKKFNEFIMNESSGNFSSNNYETEKEIYDAILKYFGKKYQTDDCDVVFDMGRIMVSMDVNGEFSIETENGPVEIGAIDLVVEFGNNEYFISFDVTNNENGDIDVYYTDDVLNKKELVDYINGKSM